MKHIAHSTLGMFTLFALLAAAILLSGCETAPTRFVPQIVKEPVNVYVYCQPAVIAEPLWATKGIDPGSDIWTQSRAMRAELEQREGFETQLKGVIDGCKQPERKSP